MRKIVRNGIGLRYMGINNPDKHAIALREAVEADLDANYKRFTVPHPNRAIATWYLLTVMEDNLRWLFAATKEIEPAFVEFQVDRQKYSARFALDRIRRECSDNSKVSLPRQVIARLYHATAGLLMAGVDFMSATQVCSSAHAGNLQFIEKESVIDIAYDDALDDVRYSALELLGHTPPDVIDHATILYGWVRYEESRPRVIHAIAQSVRIVGQQVAYEYQPPLAVALASEMWQQPSLIPNDWRFPWGDRDTTILLFNAMFVRCMYHWIAVHFGALLNGLRGGGYASLLHVSTKSRLIIDLREMCSLDESVIRRFVKYLTFGYSMKTPDPALQPIIPLGSGELIGIPCLLFLSSNCERNLLSLQARIESSTFNAMSALFEEAMVQDLLKEIARRWPLSKGNVKVRVGREFEEIDLLVPDPGTRTLLICELRWMLQPGDPREVYNRKQACWEKVDQLARKVQWLRARVAGALCTLGIELVSVDEWQVEGVVVIDTFGGTRSRQPQFPIMTARLFLQGIEKATSLRDFAAWSQSLNWLPQEHRHFRIVPQEVDLNSLGKRLVTFGIERLSTPRDYGEFVDRSLSS